MTTSIRIDAKGVGEALSRSPLVLRYVDQALGAGALLVQREAARLAPKADGTLSRNIGNGRLAQLLWQVNSRSQHRRFVEDGTGRFGPEARALNRGGLGTQGLANIASWIARKGIVPRPGVSAEQLPWLIARKIAREGTRAQPYMRPAVTPAITVKIGDLVQQGARRGLAEAGLP